MGRKLRITVVTHLDDLNPKLPDIRLFKSTNEQHKQRMKFNHDANKKTKELSSVTEGKQVRDSVSEQRGRIEDPSDDMTRQVVVEKERTGELIMNRSDATVMQRRVTRSALQRHLLVHTTKLLKSE